MVAVKWRKTICFPNKDNGGKSIGDIRMCQKVGKAMLGKSKGFETKSKESQWWDKNIQENINNKRECFKTLQLNNNMENIEKYQSIRTKTKKVISEVRSKMFERFYQALRIKNGK